MADGGDIEKDVDSASIKLQPAMWGWVGAKKEECRC